MIIPKIVFKYSRIYDEHWQRVFSHHHEKNEKYPSREQILNQIRKIEKLWRKIEKKILKELSRITGLNWKSKVIYCYVVGNCIPFSDPLTLPVYRQNDYFIDTLIHELIHQLFTQEGNLEQAKKAWEYINRNYKEESFKTRIHIPLHAIHSYIHMKFFNEGRLERDIRRISFLPDYKRSWEIVRKEGYLDIIREFSRRIK